MLPVTKQHLFASSIPANWNRLHGVCSTHWQPVTDHAARAAPAVRKQVILVGLSVPAPVRASAVILWTGDILGGSVWVCTNAESAQYDTVGPTVLALHLCRG